MNTTNIEVAEMTVEQLKEKQFKLTRGMKSHFEFVCQQVARQSSSLHVSIQCGWEQNFREVVWGERLLEDRRALEQVEEEIRRRKEADKATQ